MTRPSLRAATVAAAFLLFVPLAGATTSSGLRLTQVKGRSAFPRLTFALSLPDSRALQSGDLQVTENGAPVSGVHLVPASQTHQRTFGVVLVVDTSWSMTGKPVTAALAAVQSFVRERNPNEELGVVYFNRTSSAVVPLTTSESTISNALAKTPKLAHGTRIYDAVARAERMLRHGHISSGSIIVLSDGADTGSTASPSQVTNSALAANTRIYTVGLDDKDYAPKTLKALATDGNGEYVRAKNQALTPLFAQLGRALSSQYLLSYTSHYGQGQAGQRVQVSVNVPGIGVATAGYRTPRIPSGTTAETNSPSIGTRIVTSPITMVILALVLAAALGTTLIGTLQPRRSRLPGRIAEFVSIRDLQRDRAAATASATIVGEPTVQKDSWARFGERLEIARIGIEPEVLIISTFIATGLVFLFIFAVTGSPLWGLFALVVPYIARESVLRTLKRQRSRFAEQLPDALSVISSALRAGHSFAGSLAVVVESASEPMRSELQRVVADEQLGMPLERSLAVVADRMGSTDIDQLALVAELQRRVGGDTAEVVDRVAETVRERFDLRQLVNTLTTQGRMSRWIVSALPIVVVVFLKLENPHYFHPLISSTAGRVVVGLAAAWAVAGSLVIKKIIEIEV